MATVNRHTVSAVHRQLWAMNSYRYDVAIVKYREGRSFRQQAAFTTLAEVGDILHDLTRQNGRGENVFVRPDPCLDRALILVDDIEELDVDKLRENGLEPCLVVETSPKNLQAWVDFGPEPMPQAERKVLARWLAGFVDGDKGSADAIHYGRLAGFTNRKEAHIGEGRNGGYPFVLCQFAERLICTKAMSARRWAREQVKNLENERVASNQQQLSTVGDTSRLSDTFSRYCGYWKRNDKHARRKDGSDDLSSRDYAVVSRLLRDGYARESVVAVLASSATRKSDPQDYARRTVEAACRM